MSAAKRDRVEALCKAAIMKVHEGRSGVTKTWLTPSQLGSVEIELLQMLSSLNPTLFKPAYPRFILDSYPGGDELTDYLLQVAYQYEQQLK